MFKIWKMIKTLWYVANNYHDDISGLKKAIESHDETLMQHETVILDARDKIIERTTVNADIGLRERTMAEVVVIGRYRGVDYVRIFSVHHHDLQYVINTLKGMEQSALGRIRCIDAPQAFKAAFKQF